MRKLASNAQLASNSQKASDAIRQVSENGEILKKIYKSPTTTTTTTYRLLGPRSAIACSRSKTQPSQQLLQFSVMTTIHTP